MSNVESVRAIYEAFGGGDVAAILDRLADDVEWDQDAPGYGIPIYEPGLGKEHAKRFFEAAQDLEFLRFEPTNFLSGGNQVAVPINVEVTVKSTGKVVEALEIHLWTFRRQSEPVLPLHRPARLRVGLRPLMQTGGLRASCAPIAAGVGDDHLGGVRTRFCWSREGEAGLTPGRCSAGLHGRPERA